MRNYIPANSVERYVTIVSGRELIVDAKPTIARTHWLVSCPDHPELGDVSMWTDDPDEAVRAWIKKQEAR